MTSVEVNGVKMVIDDKLYREVTTKIVPMLKKKDKDVVFVVDGPERSGKSVFATSHGGFIASQLGTKFDLSNVCMTPGEFKNKIENSEKNEVIVYDEAHRGMASRRALSEINGILTDLMMEMGQRNLCVFIVLPTFFMLDRYPALFRARGLFHVYESKNRRGYWVYFNQKNKLKLFMKGKKEFNYNCMKFPGFRGRFYDKYVIDEEAYREKKRKSFETKDRSTRAEKYEDQRNKLLRLIIEKFDIKPKDLIFYLKEAGIELKKTQFYAVLRDKKALDTAKRLKSSNLVLSEANKVSIIQDRGENEGGGAQESEKDAEIDDLEALEDEEL